MAINNSKHLVRSGDRFSRLTVIAFSHHDKRWRRHYLTHCDCGNEKTVQGTLLRSGNTRSCGCLAHEVKKNSRLSRDAGVVNQIILQYKRHAKSRNIDWQLDRKTVDELVRQPCFYCGVVGGNLKKTKNCKEGFSHNGIDRADSTKAYTIENVVPACGFCNRAKQSLTKPDFLNWISRVSAHQQAMAQQWGQL